MPLRIRKPAVGGHTSASSKTTRTAYSRIYTPLESDIGRRWAYFHNRTGATGEIITFFGGHDDDKHGGRKHSEFNKSPENFTHAVRILMYAYVLASAPDPIESAWCSLEDARAHIPIVEQYSRMSTAAGGTFANRITEIDLAIRSEWVRTHHREPLLSLSDVITIVSRQTTLWPMAHEFRTPIRNTPTAKGQRKGYGKGS